jgi:hypothetical protein
MVSFSRVLLWLTVFTTNLPTLRLSPYFSLVLSVISLGVILLHRSSHIKNRTPYFYSSLSLILLLATLGMLSNYLNELLDFNRVLTLIFVILTIIAFSQCSTYDVFKSFWISSSSIIVLCYIWTLTQPHITAKLPSSFPLNPFDFRMTGVFIHPNILGVLCAFSFISGLVVESRKFLLTIPLITLYFTEHRSAIALTFIFLGMMGLTNVTLKPNIKNLFLMLAALLIVSFLTKELLLQPRLNSQSVDSGRSQIWSACLIQTDSLPFFGMGNNYLVRTMYNSTTLNFQAASCHNFFLENMLNFGLLYSILYTSLLIFSLAISLKKRNFLYSAIILGYLFWATFEMGFSPFSSTSSSWGFIFISIFCLNAAQTDRVLANTRTLYNRI